MLKRFLLGGIVLTLSFGIIPSALAQEEQTESITITTYYPAPYGVYNEMRAKRMAIGESYYDGGTYSWEDGTINADADLVVEGNLGIGTTNPQEYGKSPGRLDINGYAGANDVWLKDADGGSGRWASVGEIEVYDCSGWIGCASESSNTFVCPAERPIMHGRSHSGDENGTTCYQCCKGRIK